MRFLLLSMMLVAAGCSPSLQTLENTCRDLSSPNPSRKDEALKDLTNVYTWKHRDMTPDVQTRLAFCVPSVARLLDDPDEERRGKARHALHWVVSMIGPARAESVIPLLVRDAERLWGTIRHPMQKETLPWDVNTNLDVLAMYGPAARAALPLVERILGDTELARQDKEGAWNPDGTHATDVGLFAWGLIDSAKNLKAAIEGS